MAGLRDREHGDVARELRVSQETAAPTVHWAYASYFGIGWYRISDQQSAFIASFAPRWLSADIDLPVSASLSIRPSVQLSYGTAIGRSDSAWTYRGDLRARYMFRTGQLEWALIGIAGVVGYDASSETNDSITYAELGAKFAYPVSWFGSKDDQTLLYWHVIYTDFLDRVAV